jgi:hypothetical protein
VIPVVSVLLPVWNGDVYLSQAIESVLAQSYRSLELLVVDDGSSDRSLEIAEGYALLDSRVRVFRQERGGYARALNAGIREARGHFIARMDADDVAYPERFEVQVAFMRANPECVVVGSAIEALDQNGQTIGFTYFAAAHEAIMGELLRGTTSLSHPTVMARRLAVVEAGGYDPDLYPSEDLSLWLILARKGRLANIRQPLLRYRRHEAAVGVRDRAGQLQMTARIVNSVRRTHGLNPLRTTFVSAGRVLKARYHFDCARFALVGGRRRVALKHAARSIQSDPLWAVPYLAFLAALLPRRALRMALQAQADFRARWAA